MDGKVSFEFSFPSPIGGTRGADHCIQLNILSGNRHNMVDW